MKYLLVFLIKAIKAVLLKKISTRVELIMNQIIKRFDKKFDEIKNRIEAYILYHQNNTVVIIMSELELMIIIISICIVLVLGLVVSSQLL